MKTQVSKSIKVFLSELKNRIELLSGTKVTENIDNSHIDEINTILSNYNILHIEDIKAHELKRINEEDLRKLLFLVGQNNDSIEYMLGKIDEYYESIADIIKKYISDFIRIGTNQTEMFNSKINLYKEYITLFEQKEFVEPFEDINKISRVMAEVGLPDEDKWQILEYIAMQNNKTVQPKSLNLNIRIANEYDLIAEYLEDKAIVDILKERLENGTVDIDTIPTIAASLSEKTGIQRDIMINIISILIASNLVDKLELIEHEDDIEEMTDIIETILTNIVKLDDRIVYEAEDIKNERLDFFYNSVENGISEAMIKEYMELTLSEIESENVSREYAIDLKELSVLKPIFETLETVKILKKDSQEYQHATNVLKKLVEQYRILEEKKANLDKRVN